MSPSEQWLKIIIRKLPADKPNGIGVVRGKMSAEMWDFFVQVTPNDDPTLIYDGGVTYAAQREDGSIVQGYVLIRYTQGETPPLHYQAYRTNWHYKRYDAASYQGSPPLELITLSDIAQFVDYVINRRNVNDPS